MNLRNYEPDFVAVDTSGNHWLLESKVQENVNVLRKDVTAVRWCENATKLTYKKWKYANVPQKEFEMIQPTRRGFTNSTASTSTTFLVGTGDQTAEFPAIGGKHALDPHAMPLVKREDTSLEDIGRVQRALGTAHFGKREAAICVHDRLNIQVPQSSYFPETIDRADEDRFLDQ